MPCKKCKDGKYKYGNTGECKYDTKEECDKANPNKYNKMKEYPTPLGKKTDDEYAKELKEFNLSAEPKLTKVELGLVDDLKSLKKQFDSKITPAFKEISKEKSELRGKGEKAEATVNKIDNEIEQKLKLVEKQAKDLGISINDIPEYKSLKSVLSIIPDMLVVFKSVQ